MRKKIVYKKQLKNNTCGHAILEMIINYQTGIIVSQSKLIDLAPPTKEGISLYTIRKMCESYTIESESYATKDLNNIYNLPLKKNPLLLVIQKEELVHFVIVEKKRFNRFYIHDPSIGYATWIKIETIKEKWLGIFMTFHSIGILDKTKITKFNSIYKEKTKINTSGYFLYGLITIVSGFIAILSGYFFRILLANIVVNSYIIIIIICSFFLLLMVVQKLCDTISYSFIATHQITINNFIYTSFFQYITKLKEPNKNRINFLKSIHSIQEYILWKNKLKFIAPFNIFVVICYLISLTLISYFFTISLIGLTMVMMFIIYLINKKHLRDKEISKESNLETTFLTGLLLDDLELVIYGDLHKQLISKLLSKYEKSSSCQIYTSTKFAQLLTLTTIIFSLSTMIIYIISLLNIYNNQLVIDDIIPALLITSNYWFVQFNLLQSIFLKPNKLTTKKVLDSFLKMFYHQTIFRQNITNFTTKRRNLFFVFNNSYCISGSNGSGKTTFLKSICKGEFIIDNKSCNNNLFEYLFLSSKVVLVLGNVKDNILLTNNASKKLFDINYKKYHLEKFLSAQKLTLDTYVFANEDSLSNGQKQLINILRIFTRNDNICLIDEGFNAIAPNIKLPLFKCIKNYFKNKILIIVSHNIDLMNNCDYKIEFKNG